VLVPDSTNHSAWIALSIVFMLEVNVLEVNKYDEYVLDKCGGE